MFQSRPKANRENVTRKAKRPNRLTLEKLIGGLSTDELISDFTHHFNGYSSINYLQLDSPSQTYRKLSLTANHLDFLSIVKKLTYLLVGNFFLLPLQIKMDTRTEIIRLGDSLIREKGYNAFSFGDISKQLNIKNASVHYHFPIKSDLGIAIIEQQIERLNHIIYKYSNKTPIEKLDKFLSIYTHIKSENKVCLVGSLATDLNTVDENIKETLKTFSSLMLGWVTNFLEEGRNNNMFQFNGLARTKAIMIIGNMIAIVQLSRLTNDKDFKTIKDTIKQELIKK